jgi:hypothetical protein
MLRDPWLEPVRAIPKFTKLFKEVQERYRATEAEFSKLEGNRILQMGTYPA